MTTKYIKFAAIIIAAFISPLLLRGAIVNPYGREHRLLNGRWDAIPDLYDQGVRMKVYENRKPTGNTDFFEYSFDGGMRLDVPGDWNSQNPELKYYEGTVWYARKFNAEPQAGKKSIIYFCGVNYRTRVYLNGKLVGEHEGGFTPFECDVTEALKPSENFLTVEVNNRRTPDAIPALAFDWWNYGGITRDVMLLNLPSNYIKDYFIRVSPSKPNQIDIDIAMSDAAPGTAVSVNIPELGARVNGVTDSEGKFHGVITPRKLKLWNPGAPKLYDVEVSGGNDKVSDRIGFRQISTRGTEILVNGRPQFMRCVSFHEEIPQRQGRACTAEDASLLIGEAEELGVNMVRLAHYPQNEHTIREAEERGILLWEEIPVWQGISFADSTTLSKAKNMLVEMINRDKNRCAVGFWGIANETKPSPERNAFLRELLGVGKSIDTSRLYTAAFDLVEYNPSKGVFTMNDSITNLLDVVAVNKYMGWYHPWPVAPANAVWDVNPDKPLIISEFGGEALYGQEGGRDTASSWSEDYQARLYEDNLRMFENIPNLAGVSPWILFDFRSPFRFHPQNQEGWNRKGLISDRGQRKKAWKIMHDYYTKKRLEYEK